MGIEHNPASPGTSYCDNGGTWYLNNSQVASFSGSSSYSKEDVPPIKKITWDTTQQYTLINSNYFYEIKATTTHTFRLGIRDRNGTCRGLFGYANISGRPVEAHHTRPNGGCAHRLTFYDAGGILRTLSEDIGCQFLLDGPWPKLSSICDYQVVSGNPNWRIYIRDGSANFDYPITNINSVQIVDIPSNNAKFIFGGITEIIADKNSIVTVTCNCPPTTIDCGDCCLPCDDVFNGISEIRSFLSRLK